MASKDTTKSKEVPIKREKTQEYLKCDFSEKEVSAFADELSRKIGELELKRTAKKDVVKSIDAEIAKIETDISSLATKVKDKYEYKMIPCEVVFDYKRKEKDFTRPDTGEIYKTLPLQEHELQTTFTGVK